MSPEEPGKLVIIDTWLHGKKLLAKGCVAFNPLSLRVSWYSRKPPPDSKELGGGTVYVYNAAGNDFKEIAEANVPRKGGFYYWGDTISDKGLMIAVILPEKHTITTPVPMLREAKEVEALNRMAVYWMFKGEDGEHVEARWKIEPTSDLQSAVDDVSRLTLDVEDETANIGGGPQIFEEPTKETKQALINILIKYFSKDELDELCFDLEIDPEDIKGEAKRVRAREIILYLDRRTRLHELAEIGPKERPNAPWPIIGVPPY